MALVVKNPPANAGDVGPSLGGEDPLEEGMAPHSSILAWRIQWMEKPCELQFIASQKVRHYIGQEMKSRNGCFLG